MTVVRRLLVLAVFVSLAAAGSAFASAANIYITQSGSASGSCTSSVQTPAFFNTASNWGSGASQIGPGTTVLICGTFTGTAGATEFTFQGSGTSASPVTLQFDTGAQLTAPYWSGNGAISCSGKSYVVVNGGTNGLIQNTANGTSLSYHQPSSGFSATNCTYSTVKNLTIQNMYVNQGSSSSATDTAGSSAYNIIFIQNSTGSIAANNTVSQARAGITFSPDSNGDASNIQISGNNVSDTDWGINVGGGDSGDTMNNVSIYGNTITNWTNWQFPTGTYHQDGIILFNVGNPSAGLTANIYNNHIYGDLGVGSPTGFIYCADFTSCTIYNNLLVNTGHVIYGIMWLGQSSDLGKNMDVYNNTIIDTTGTQSVCMMMNLTGTAKVENNICTGSKLSPYSTYLSSLSAFEAIMTTSNYNDWNTGSTAWGSQESGSTASYATWTGAGYDANSIQTSPNLTSSYGLNAGSPAISLGANLTSLGMPTLNTDMAGTARPSTGAWAAGAYAYGTAGTQAPAAPSGVTVTVQP